MFGIRRLIPVCVFLREVRDETRLDHSASAPLLAEFSHLGIRPHLGLSMGKDRPLPLHCCKFEMTSENKLQSLEDNDPDNISDCVYHQ